ncbi:DUF6507 family protein [Marinitenerispora sediminis]|uniref:ESX-1 secretion-associated protein n=1 Tax=Marinitenerispora sediminis TaxID=1931232 RepID=A0A368T090_9ACTN|nr:DUF6507 family protein [Marinitenerispora sediminis]RCV48340.1 hypothetical protein DEF28_23855 [Marinitenerispora sediminis]RCV49517.1 hypothetical protein DEF23_23500 [Marinitenerispora sediminis]RCV52329.1 hypothetical protein DEF24_22145 [Marinitenerispora sediminis]
MSGWDIDAPAVGTVMTTVGGYVQGDDGTGGLVGKITTFAGNVENAGAQAASGPISTALGEFVEEYAGKLQSMVLKSASAVGGCTEATMAYLDGDLEMAATAQEGAGRIDA